MNTEKRGSIDGKADRLIKLINKQYRRIKQKRVAARLLLSLSVILAGFSLLVWLEQEAYFSSAGKISWAAVLVLLGVLSFIWSSWAISFGSFNLFYSSVSQAIQLPSLKHAFDLKLYHRDSQLRLYSAALKRNVENIPWQEVRPRINTHLKSLPEAKFFRQSLGAIALASILLLFSGLNNQNALVRSAKFWENFQKPNPYSFSILPGNVTIEQGSSFQPEILFKGAVPQSLLLGIKTDVEENFRFRPLKQKTDDTFTPDPVNLSSNATYFIRMDEFESERFEVKVQLRPRFESFIVNVIPPEYTGLDPTVYTYPFSQVKAYRGSNIQLTARANKPVTSLMLISASGDSVAPSSQNGLNFTFNKEVTVADTMMFEMSDTSGLTNNNSFEFTVEPVDDEYPFVQIVKPEENIEQNAPAPIDIQFDISDDFGITSASLQYELHRAFVEEPRKGSFKLTTPELNSRKTITWDLTRLNPRPRDVITFWIKVTDNDGYNGPKSSVSRKLTVTLPSLVENLDDIEQRESEVQESLEDISKSYEEMRDEYDRFKKNLKENPETNWEQRQMLEEIQKKQQKINKEVDELNKKFNEIREKINENNLVSEETQQAYKELQKLIEEINDPEMLKALEELKNALGNLNQQQLRKALEEFEFNEEIYRERLNRTINLFKTLKLNSDLEKMATALEDLAKKEEELSKSKDSPSDKAEQQESIQKDTKKVSDQLDELDDDPPQNAREKLEKLQEESRKELDSVQQQLKENIERLQQQTQPEGEPTPQQQQRQIQQQFQQMAQKMRQAKQQFNQQRTRINMTALQNILYNLINLSEEQEELTQNTEHLANRSQAFVEKARVEKNISEQFSQISDSLFSVSSEIPGFSNSINKKKKEVERNLSMAVEQLAERNKSQSTYAERQSLGGINDLSSLVASLMDKLQNQAQNGMGGGMTMQHFMEQIKNMSGDQQKLNQMIQNLINDIQGDRLTTDQIERLNQMARQQNMIRKQIKQLQENGGLEAGDRMLSELERMAEEMEEAINDMRGGQTDRLMIERQQNILSRMLSAEKALEERDKSEEREGTASEEQPKSVPPEVTLEELQKKIRSLMNDPNQTKFSEDYQRLIEQYFELLKKLQKGT